MSTLCKSGRHSWIDPKSRAMCCNGYHRETRYASELHGAELDGLVKVDGEPLYSVWVKDEPAAP